MGIRDVCNGMKNHRHILLAGFAACAFALGTAPYAAARDGDNHRNYSDHGRNYDHGHSDYHSRYNYNDRYRYGYARPYYGYRATPSFGLSVFSVSRPVVRTVAPVYAYSGDRVVADVQAQLNDRGYGAGPVDGLMGRRTSRAIAAFQSRNGMYVTGAIDEPLLRALRLI